MNSVREGYKMTELGEIPSEWEVKKLKELLDVLKDGTHNPPKRTEEGIPLLSAENIFNGKINYGINEKCISEEDYELMHKNYNIEKDDILMTIVGTIGRVAVVKDNKKFTVQRSVAILRSNKKVNNLFLTQFLSSTICKKELDRKSNSTAQAGLYLGELGKINIIVPSIKEQEKIASILLTVDEQIDNVDALIEKNKELKKGLMQTLLTKGIGHTKFKKTEIGEIPSEWDIKSIDEITKEVYRYPTYYGIEYVEEGIAEIRGELLNDDASIKKESFRYISEKTAKKFPRTKLEVGDIVISVRGTIGKVGYITEELAGSNITANLLRVSMNRNIMNEHFIKQLFLSDIMKRKFDEITTATTIKTFKVPEFKQIILAIPTKDEQDKIASILLEVDKKIEEHENKKQKLENLKKGLMQQLLTGKIRTI